MKITRKITTEGNVVIRYAGQRLAFSFKLPSTGRAAARRPREFRVHAVVVRERRMQYVVDRSMITMYTKVYNNVTCGDAIEHARSLQRDPRRDSLSTYIQFPILSPSFALGRLCPLRFSMTVMAVSLGKVKDAPKVEKGHRYSKRAFRRIDFRQREK